MGESSVISQQEEDLPLRRGGFTRAHCSQPTFAITMDTQAGVPI